MIDRKTNTKKMITAYAGILAVLGLLILLKETDMLDNYYIGIINQCCYAILMVTSLNIATGFLGQLALGHCGFMAIGAYSAALLAKALINSGAFAPGLLLYLISLVFGAAMAGLFGMLVGIPALRLRGDYLAIITLGFGEIIRVIIQNLPFAGGMGLGDGKVGQPLIGIMRFNDTYIIFIVMALSVMVLFAFVRSKYGRAITAIRDNDIAASSVGLNTTYYKVLAFTISAIFAGVAGGIYAFRGLGTIQSGDFSFIKSTEYVIMVIVGGMGSLSGSVLSAIALSILPEVLRAFSDYRMLVYSVLLIIMMVFRPTGLFGRYEFSLYNALQWLKHPKFSFKKKQIETAQGEEEEQNG